MVRDFDHNMLILWYESPIMSLDPDVLPDDVDTLRAALVATQAALVAERAERQRLEERNERLEHFLQQLRRMQFGKRSEKLDPDQLNLALEDIEQAVALCQAEAEKAEPEVKRRRSAERRRSRGALPPHLPRIEIVVEPEATACPCCQGSMHVIGEDRSERLDIIPARYQVIPGSSPRTTRRPKYGCRACSGAVVQAPAPARLIEGGLPTEQLVANVLTGKYADHMPLYRQAQALARQGIEIDRSTLAFWVGYAAAELMPLWELMRADLLSSAKLFVDETRAPVLDPGRGRTKTGYFWAIARDDRPWRGTDPPAVVYTYAPGRGTEHAAGLLRDFTGIIQTDAYIAYKKVANGDGAAMTIAYCWAHLRREFIDITRKAPAPLADEALRRIAALYAIEAEIRGRSADERRAARQERTKPLVLDLKLWFVAQLARISGKSTLAGAIRYALNQWDGLVRFLDDGRIEMDSNTVERSMRPIALNRKNALFAGHDQGAENWACLASLIETCKLHGVNAEAYLADVLTKLVNNWPNSRLAELTPWAWAAARKNDDRIAA